MRAGQNVDVPFHLKVASVEESLTVTAETPVVDSKKVGIQHTIDKDEMTAHPHLP